LEVEMLKGTSRPLAFAGLAILLVGAEALAEDAEPIRGAILRIEDNIIVVRSRNGSESRLKLAANAAVAARANTALWEVREGTYLGIVGIAQPDGSQRAIEVHIFHETLRGAAEGHRPADLATRGSMTFGTAWHIARTADGQSATLYYMGGAKSIVIASAASTFTYLPGSVAQLEPGAEIFVPAAVRLSDGALEAQYVMLERHDAPHR
jgi:hypothetical protein